MTIKSDKSMAAPHCGLIKFMKDFRVSVRLVAKLLKCSENAVHRYRCGNRQFTKKTLIKLKTNYVNEMQKKINCIKLDENTNKYVHNELINFMWDFEISGEFAAILLKCSRNSIYRYRYGTKLILSETLIELKTNYINYMEKKLKSIKV